MAGPILAIVSPDNVPGGSILTFAFPMALFIVAAVVLYLLFTRPHQVPGHKKLASARASSGVPADGDDESGARAAGSAAGGGNAAPAEGAKAPE